MEHNGTIDHRLYELTSEAMRRLAQDLLRAELAPAPENDEGSISFSFRELAAYKYPARAYHAENALAVGDESEFIKLIQDQHRLTDRCHDFFKHLKDVCSESVEPLEMRELTTDMFLNINHCYGHGVGIVTLHHSGEASHFLIDPTFRQFSYFIPLRDKPKQGEDFILPADHLRMVAPDMHAQLMLKGYVQLNEERANAYLQSFNTQDQTHRIQNALGLIVRHSPVVVEKNPQAVNEGMALRTA